MPPSAPSDDRRRLLIVVMSAVAIWGIALAFGAYLYGPDPTTGQVVFSPSVVRGGIVLGFVATFLGGWALLLRGRRFT